MNTFSLQLQDATQSRRFDGICSFVGEDASGSFGLLAGHTRFITSLTFGLAKFRALDCNWQYLAMPGALLYFSSNLLWIGTRRFLLDDDYAHINTALKDQLLHEEQALSATKQSLRQMEEELLRRLWRMGQSGD